MSMNSYILGRVEEFLKSTALFRKNDLPLPSYGLRKKKFHGLKLSLDLCF